MNEYLKALEIASQFQPKDYKLAQELALEFIGWAYLNSGRCPEDVLQKVARKTLEKGK